MDELLHATNGSEAVERVRADAASSFIAIVYFKQATTLLDRGLYDEAEGYFREVLRLWPDHPGTLNNLGTAVWRQGRIHEAEELHRHALDRSPNDYAILNNLGNILWKQGRLDEAVPWYRQAVQLRPDSPEALMNLGVTLSDLGEFDEALRWIRESLRLQPDSPDSHVNAGNVLARQGNQDGALECYERALHLRADFPEARRNRSYIWLTRGEFERGWPEHEWRLRCAELLLLPVNSPRWTGEDLDGRSILLLSEQGLGDTLQFIRFARLVKERKGRVVVACPKPLIRLAARIPGVDRVVDWKSALPECDLHAPLLSLPAILGTTVASLPAEPYLSVDAATVEKWRPIVARALRRRESAGVMRPDSAFTIGIAWQGNKDHKGDHWRSFPLTHFAHLAKLSGVRLISLQKGDGAGQLTDLAGRFPVGKLTRQYKSRKDRRDFLDTAAVMSQLDLVVTPDSSLAHLAGGLGVRVWVPLSTVGEWRWLFDRDDSPWYPTMRLFRQTTFDDWASVFKRMADVLSQELTTARSRRPGCRP
jgi:tetratricopeptide (TPR) repeat protein